LLIGCWFTYPAIPRLVIFLSYILWLLVYLISCSLVKDLPVRLFLGCGCFLFGDSLAAGLPARLILYSCCTCPALHRLLINLPGCSLAADLKLLHYPSSYYIKRYS
jgi:hypothetical protein